MEERIPFLEKENIVSVTPLLKGWSRDQKYVLEDANGCKFLLRISDGSLWEKKKAQFALLEKMEKRQLPCSRPLALGMTEEGSVYTILSYLEGTDGLKAVSKLGNREAYRLGIEAGEVLRRLHEIEIPPQKQSWWERYQEKMPRKIAALRKCEYRLPMQEELLQYYTDHCWLMKNRPQLFAHGDFHLGNMIVKGGKIGIIDFDKNGAAAQSQQSEEALLSALESAQAAYEDALSNLDRTDLSYGQAIRTADLPQGSNHAAQMGQLTYDQLVLELEKLQALWDAGGEILAPVDGVVTECSVRTGGKTSDLGAVLLADLSQGCKFSGLLSKEQAKYIGVGDQVSLRSESTGKTYDKLPVTTLSAEPEGGYRLTVQLPQNSLPLGAGADLRFTRRSQAYFCCVPLSALHLDERNQPYVLVAEPAETVLGTQTLLRKVSVQVLEQNESLAALEPGCLHSEQQVVTASDRAVGSGSRVRVN